MKPEIGFIGLGTMGKWMAVNLIQAGFPLKFYARRKEIIEEVSRLGGKALPSPKALAQEVAWLIFCLPNTDTVEEILFGREGITEVLKSGQAIIDCSTIHPLSTRKFAELLKGCGVSFLDAPISGMEARAKAGTLTIMAGGDPSAFEQVRPALEAMGKTIVYMGASGNGQLMKLVNQLLFDINCATIAEILPMAVKMGLDPEQTVAVARTGTGQSFALDNFGPQILEGKFSSGYPMDDAYKDMAHAAEISSLHRLPLPVFFAAMVTYQMALDQGYGRENKGAMIKVWEKVFGVQVRKGIK